MICITLATPDEYSTMAEESARRFREFTGEQNVFVVPTENSFKDKFNQLLAYRDSVTFFDSDWWLVKPMKILHGAGNFIIGAPNEAGLHIYNDQPIDQRLILCSCFFSLDMADAQARRAVEIAKKLQDDAKDYKRDEYYLNIGIQRAGLQIVRLSTSWNYCAKRIDRSIAVHAAGREDKLNWLKENTVI